MSQSYDDDLASIRSSEDQVMAEISQRPLGARLKAYTAMSGPGWLQGAITLGGGSLAGALYLGVIMGYHMLWLQPLAMLLGVVMLSAIAYVTLSTGLRPFRAIQEHVSPVLAWAWIIATLMANIVWCMPQFGLARAAIQQNLIPSLGSSMGSTVGICVVLFLTALVINFFYESGKKGVKRFEIILKLMVAVIVLSFFGVVGTMTVSGALPWGQIFAGHIPDFSLFTQPAPAFRETVAAAGAFSEFWSTRITNDQRDIMMTAFGTAVGINMTFLLPYSMLRKGWGRHHRGLAIFDLSIGLIVPFVLATGCVVIAAASQFHASTADVIQADGTVLPKLEKAVNSILDDRVKAELGTEGFTALSDAEKAERRAALPAADRTLAAMLVKRDTQQLANALVPLTGPQVAQVVFGIGVLGMALSTIIILMLINGFTLCEMLNQPGNRAVHMAGAVISGLGGALGLIFLWGDGKAQAALAVPTSVIGGAMIPIAYFTFLLLMNSSSLLGAARPKGAAAVRWNVLMGIATAIATTGSIWVLMGKGLAGKIGMAVLITLFVLGLIGFLGKSRRHAAGRG
jgi:Mn2+/Fe2+ NRAMP family transporter